MSRQLLCKSSEQDVHYKMPCRLLRWRQFKVVRQIMSNQFRSWPNRQKMQNFMHLNSRILRWWPEQSLCPTLSRTLLPQQSNLPLHRRLHNHTFDVQILRNQRMRLQLSPPILLLRSQQNLPCWLPNRLLRPAVNTVMCPNLRRAILRRWFNQQVCRCLSLDSWLLWTLKDMPARLSQ